MFNSTTNIQNFINEERMMSDVDSQLAAMRARKVAAEAEQELLDLEAAELLRLAKVLRSALSDLTSLLAQPGFNQETDGETYKFAFGKAAAAKQELLEFYLESATYQKENTKHVVGVNIAGTQLARIKPVLDDFRSLEPEAAFEMLKQSLLREQQELQRKTNRQILAVVTLSALIPAILAALAIC